MRTMAERGQSRTSARQAGTAASAALTRKALLFDIVERVIVSLVFASFAWRMVANFQATANGLTLLLFVSEALPFVYVMLRAPSATLSQHPIDWTFGVMGTVAPLLVRPVAVAPLVPLALCFVLMVVGLCIQIAAKVVLGRAFGIIAANRGIRVVGPYRIIRHPMYAGYTITQIGFLLSMPSPLNAALYALALTLQIARIYREERVLMHDARYRKLAARVRYRLLPGVF